MATITKELAMPTLSLRFPGGRYHATPWGHHVNEGLIEWPPSPWRVLRALIATGFGKLSWSEIPPVGRKLIEKLASVLPSYLLPESSAAHSRHYMPIIEGKSQKTTLVFDTWANLGDGELLIHWPCELDADELDLLCRLASTLSYLGRSESWAEAELIDKAPAQWNAEPFQEGDHRGPGWEQISLMAAIPPAEYCHWRSQQVDDALRPFQSQRQTAAVKKRLAQAIEPYPPDLSSCLTKDTSWWKGHGWSQPPGSQRVLYWRQSDSLRVGVPMATRRLTMPPVECMLLAITSSSGNCSALPSVTRTLPQAELLHRAVISKAANGQSIRCPSLTGRDDEGNPLQGYHEHAYTIPLDLDGDQHIDHVLIYARMGLCGSAQDAIRSLKRTWTKGGVGDLQLAVVGNGSLDSLRRLPPPLIEKIEACLGPPQGACLWESVTPFVPPRYLKPRGKNSLFGQVNAELASRNLPAIDEKSVDICGNLTRSLRHFVRRRRHGRTALPIDMGFGLRLHFSEPIKGPLLLGFGSHFGLGLFQAIPQP
jgi:CRISPR-associated protein Csb2